MDVLPVHYRAALLLILALTGSNANPSAARGAQNTPPPFQISVAVDLVVLHASVQDRRGQFIAGLRREDFEVFEDGVRQSLRVFQHEDLAATVGLVIDHSGSMAPKLAEVKSAAGIVARSGHADDELFVVNFNERVTVGLPKGTAFSSNPNDIENAIWRTPTGGMTALYDALGIALDRLKTGSRERKALIVVSDGGDNASSRHLAEVMNQAERSSAIIYTIGIFDAEDPDKNPGVLKRLAQTTGGSAFFPAAPGELNGIAVAIARDLRNQYTLGYVSTNASHAGGWRAIRVRAKNAQEGKLQVRTRSGYFAGDAQ